MKLILTTDVPGLGAPGDIVEVKDGYGRNFLVPQGHAIAATKGAEKQVATIKRAQLAREIRGTEHANEVKQALEKLGAKLTITARTTSDGKKLFGSIGAADVAAAIKSAGGPTVDKRAVDVEGGHIKSVGSHPVSVKLHPGVTAQISVTVVSG
jgi:large subunit ribosomal protein L9